MLNFEFYEPIKPEGWDPVNNVDSPIIHIDGNRFSALVAPFGVCHSSDNSKCWTVPKSPSGYEFAHNGEFGFICAWLDHADPYLDPEAARSLYSNTDSAVARVKYYDLDDGVYCFGEVSPFLSDKDKEWLFSMALSGDWRKVGPSRKYDLVAAQVVPVPGFRRDKGIKLASKNSHNSTKSLFSDYGTMVASFDFDPADREKFDGLGFFPETMTASFDFGESLISSDTENDLTDKVQFSDVTIAMLDTLTGDDRIFKSIDLSISEIPLTIDHKGKISSVVGKCKDITRLNNQIIGTIVFDLAFPETEMALRVLDSVNVGYSIEVDNVEVENVDEWYAGEGPLIFTSARLRAVSLVVVPAFSETQKTEQNEYINSFKSGKFIPSINITSFDSDINFESDCSDCNEPDSEISQPSNDEYMEVIRDLINRLPEVD